MLSIQDVSRELRVSEKTIRRMLWRGEINGIRVGGQWRFPVENLAGLLPARTPVAAREQGTPIPQRTVSIRESIEVGGIHHRIAGETPDEVLRNIVNATTCVPRAARPALFEAVREREALCSTGIGNGVAVPHPRVPARTPDSRIPSCIALHFLESPVDFGSVDNEKVSVLFLLLSSPQEHLQALARLIRLLREDSLLSLLRRVPLRDAILAEIARLEGTLIVEGP